MRVLVQMDGANVLDVFAIGHPEAPPDAIEVDADREVLGADSMGDYSVAGGRLIRSEAKIAERKQAEAAALEARAVRVANAKASLSAAQSVPQLRDAVATLFAELGL